MTGSQHTSGIQRRIWFVCGLDVEERLRKRVMELLGHEQIVWTRPEALDRLANVESLDMLVIVHGGHESGPLRGLRVRARARGVAVFELMPRGSVGRTDAEVDEAIVTLVAQCGLEEKVTLGKTDRRSSETPVAIAVAAPATVKPGEEFVLRFAAYPDTAEDVAAVEALLTGLSPGVAPRMGLRRQRWAHGTLVQVRVRARGVRVSRGRQQFVWQGWRELLDFLVRVDKEVPVGQSLQLQVGLTIAGVTVASIVVSVNVQDHGGAAPSVHRQRVATSAFASYAALNSKLVLHRVSSLRSAAGMDVFVDCLDLEPGERFKPRLESEIRNRHLFLLFWSSDAARSEWVEWEWRTAIAFRGLAAIRPQPLQTDYVPLPSELSELHARDVFMALAGYCDR